MPNRLTWTPEALADLERLHAFLKPKSKAAAANVIRLIRLGAAGLKATPGMGKPMGDRTERRELYLPFSAGAYVVRYTLDNKDNVFILRVWHSREDRFAE